MKDKPVIIVGLVIAVAALTFPFWYALAGPRGGSPPEVELPAGESKRCVEDRDFMKAHHMELLNQWRDAVVRDGGKEYESEEYPGDVYEMSLTRTCLGCHDVTDESAASVGGEPTPPGRARFCYQCHAYVDVEPTCWECHLVPEGK
jgi:hypothetical protein